MNQQTQEMTAKQKKAMKSADFKRRYGRWWLIYVALCCSAALSFIGGFLLPFMRTDIVVDLTWATFFAGAFYALGFITNGEGAFTFWFDKVTDQDPDNSSQKAIAGLMIAASVFISATTALATSYIITWWVGVFDTFLEIPAWAQKYIAIMIPIMWVTHMVAGVIFRAVSEEAFAERETRSRIKDAENEAAEIQARAESDYIIENAPQLAEQMGRMKAKSKLDNLRNQIEHEAAKSRRLTGHEGRRLPPPVDQRPDGDEGYRNAPPPVPSRGIYMEPPTPRRTERQYYIYLIRVPNGGTPAVNGEDVPPFYAVPDSQRETARAILGEMYPPDADCYYTVGLYEKEWLDDLYAQRGQRVPTAPLPFSLTGLSDKYGMPDPNAHRVSVSRNNGNFR